MHKNNIWINCNDSFVCFWYYSVFCYCNNYFTIICAVFRMAQFIVKLFLFWRQLCNYLKQVKFYSHYFFFSIRIFFHRHWRLTGQQGKGGNHLLFHSTSSTRSRTFRHLLATLHVRWLSHIFNRTGCVYQAATQWDFYRTKVASDKVFCENGVLGCW